MPKISTYTQKAVPIPADEVVGTNSEDGDKTVQFPFSAILGALSNPPVGGYKITNIFRSASGDIVFGYDTEAVT